MAYVNWTTYNMQKPKDWVGKTYTPTQFVSQQSPYANQTYRDNYAYDVRGARTNLNKHQLNKPTDYQSGFQPKINELLSEAENRKSFTYDPQKDGVYKQLQQRAIATGKQNMKNAMGQAAANTGGFGSSYAQIVGNQEYNQSMLDLQNQIPSLMETAYGRYQDATNDIYNRLNMLQTQDDIAYGRHRDNVTDWNTENDRLTNLLTTLQQLDRSAFDSDRAFNQSAWEFGENQRYNAWSDSEARRQASINAENANSLAKWQQQWNNYWNGENQSAANKANALDMLYKLTMMEQDGYKVTGF